MLVFIKESKYSTRKAVARHLAVHRNTTGTWLTIYGSRWLDGSTSDKVSRAPSDQRSEIIAQQFYHRTVLCYTYVQVLEYLHRC